MRKKPDNSNKLDLKAIKSKGVKNPDEGGPAKEELYHIPEDIREKIYEIQTASFYQGTLPPPEYEAQVRREWEYFSRLSPQELVKEILVRLDAAKPNPVNGISCPEDTVCYLGQCPYRF